MFDRVLRIAETLVFLIVCAVFLGYSTPPSTDQIEDIRAYTRDLEFNYITWTFDAALLKWQAATVGLPDTIPPETQKQIVKDYLHYTQLSLEQERQLEQLYADASILDKVAASADLRAEIKFTHGHQARLAPIAEAVIQNQVSAVLEEQDLTAAGQPVPSVLYHATPLPMALIVSPRDRIEQTANISIETNLTVDAQAQLENQVDEGTNVSSLVVPIGGVGVYPTMVMRSTDLRWILEVVAHEWIHNYLTLRPLGLLYDGSPELRTMNETTASLAGTEIGTRVLQRFYPETAGTAGPAPELVALPDDHPNPRDLPRPTFDFRAEMHETRVTVDAMLANGEIEAAEHYMEARRQIFLQHGYLLRKINQAYFAFYGAYADVPGGAAGEDPVGPAVRALREQSSSLADFINRISWMTSFEQLQDATAR